MALRGTQAKADFIEQLLKAFPNSFKYDKEIRVPIYDATSGEQVQLKIAITCAKENVECGNDIAIPTPTTAAMVTQSQVIDTASAGFVEPSKEEINSMKSLLSKYNL